MATKTLTDLPVASTPANADITHIRQSSVDKSLTLNLLSEFVQRDSDFSTLIATIAVDKDYLAAELERDARIFANCTAATITLGLFNGSSRDGEIAIITCIGTANQVNVELVTTGVTDVILSSKDTLTVIWNVATAAWQILNIDRGAVYDFIVRTQEDFNFIVERVAANQYKFKDGFTSIYFKFLTGGYLMYGGTSFLSGGDTWGYIETNNCINLIFESGAYLHTGNERGYLKINTNECYLLNVDIRGLGTVASNIVQSFLVSNDYVTLDNCRTSIRLTNTNMYAFSCGGDYINCINCTAHDLTGNAALAGFVNVGNTNNYTNCISYNLQGAANTYGFYQVRRLSNCIAHTIISTTTNAYGFQDCIDLVNCRAEEIDHNGAVAAQSAYGFHTCVKMSNCNASNIDTNGAGGRADGFNTCTNISTSFATTCNDGFFTCTEISVCKSYSNSEDGFDTCTGVSSSYSTGNTGWGFKDCKHLQSNRSSGNTAGQYTTSYADLLVANAAADTAAGGYNG